MNIHQKENRMTVEEAVAKGADTFAQAEQRAHWIKKNFRDLREVFEAIRDGGMIGGLETQALASEADALATVFEADIYRLHAELTARAKELGIDLPSIESGGR
jgi:hypothetical protein